MVLSVPGVLEQVANSASLQGIAYLGEKADGAMDGVHKTDELGDWVANLRGLLRLKVQREEADQDREAQQGISFVRSNRFDLVAEGLKCLDVVVACCVPVRLLTVHGSLMCCCKADDCMHEEAMGLGKARNFLLPDNAILFAIECG